MKLLFYFSHNILNILLREMKFFTKVQPVSGN
jgi:hypothetical protein